MYHPRFTGLFSGSTTDPMHFLSTILLWCGVLILLITLFIMLVPIWLVDWL